jgi:TonB family protein
MRALAIPGLLVFVAFAFPGEGPRADALPAPRLARELRLAGDVVVEALVDSTGVVRATNVLRSQPALDDSACMIVAARHFDPARDEAGRPVAGSRTVPVRFESPKAVDVAFTQFRSERCAQVAFALELAPRPDSTGRLTARWTARGPRYTELRLLVLSPDGVEAGGEGPTKPQRLLDSHDAPGWPAWRRTGKQLRNGTSGEISLRLPASPWWSAGRVAFVALFRDPIYGGWIVRQVVYRIERDEMGALLVRDPAVDACLAGPDRLLPPGAVKGLRFEPTSPERASEPSRAGPR